MNKLWKITAIIAFAAGLNMCTGAEAAEPAPRNCLTSVPITSTFTQVICPNAANERQVEKTGTFYLTLPADCPASTSGGSVVGGTITYSGGSGTTTQTSGGYLAGSSPTLIAQEECFGPNCTGKVCELNKDCSGSSVILANGTYEFTEVDLKIPSRAIPVEWKRTYRSNRVLYKDTGLIFGEPIDGPLGFGWTNQFFARIENENTYVDGEGRYITFKKDASGNFITDAENGLSLKKTTAGFEVKERGGLTRVFDTNGKLKEVKDPRGKSLTLVYGVDGSLTSIKDASYRQVLTFSYTNNRITTVTDNVGRSVRYEYDPFGNLTSSIDPATKERTYTYNTYHGLTSKSNPLGETYTIDYLHPDKGVTSKVIDPPGTALLLLGQPTTGHEKNYLYDFSNKTFYVTDWNGKQVKKTINDSGRITSETETASGAVLRKIEYLANRVEVHTDSAGNTTTLQKDEWGNVTKSTDGEGNETVISYNTENMPVSVTDPLGTITIFEYDNTGMLLTKVVQASGKPEQVTTDFTYTAFGEVESKTVGGATTSFTYNEMGLPITITESITDLLNKTIVLEYDQYGNLSAFIDPSNNRTEFIFDVLGNLIETNDPLKNKTIYTHNDAGRLVKVKDALLRETNYETDFKGRITAVIAPAPLNYRKEYKYDGNGNLIKIIEGTAEIVFTYDSSNRLTSIKDAENNTTTYEYTTASSGCTSCGGGNISIPAKVRDPLGNLTEYSFDKSGKIAGIKDPLLKLTDLAYDAGGRISTRTDANGNKINYEYDSLGRLKKQINVDALNGNKEILFSYDYRGNLASLTDPNGHTTTFEYDLANRKIKETNPLFYSTEYSYYPNDLLKSIKDANGQIATYNYDSAGRLVKVIYNDLKEDNFTYDAVGNLLTYSNESVSGSITYDELNRKLNETVNYGAFSKTYSYTYDDRGNKATYTSPEGVVYSYTYRLNNQLAGISFGTNITFEYLKNRHTKTILPNGVTTDYQYNANSWLTYITTKQGTTTLSDYNYGFDNVGNITNKTTEHGNYNYSYDTTYQLTDAVSPAVSEGFTYDNTGNRLTDSTATSLTFGTWGYYYNSRNRLERVTLPDGRTATYTYDPFGRRVKKDVAGQVTYYAYSDEGLIGEYDANGNLSKAYGWEPDSTWGTSPVFMVEGGNYYFYHNDHLGTPHKLTDINGNTVWSATYAVFGKVSLTGSITNNLRFPGQYLDEETGLHYNWNRYYDPGTGRYTQEDPIGFEAGDENLYRYAFGNPLSFTDPEGLLVDTLADLGFIGYDLYDLLNTQNECEFDESLKALGLDLAGAALPFVTGLGTAYRAEKALQKGSKYWTKADNFRGIKVYKRDDLIDLNKIDKKGLTNLERMKKGWAPIGPDGEAIELHHLTQMDSGPIAEITKTMHQKYKDILHINPSTTPSGINRKEFDKFRELYWKDRAKPY